MIKVACPGCDKKYSVPDEKIPAGKTLDLPCPACKTIIKVTAAGNTYNDDQEKGQELFKKIIKTSVALPPMPEIMAKATKILSDDNAGFKDVGDVLETDQAMATRVLKLANSAYYGLSVPVSTVQQASALLGFQTLIELITVVSTSKMMGTSLKGYDISSSEMWIHSLSVATASKLIAEKKHPDLASDAFNAGLIHDSGMIIIDEYIEKNKEGFRNIVNNGSSIHSAEKQILGFNHAEIASEFFKKWNLPSSQTKAIKFHHHPQDSEKDMLSYILHVADYIVMSDSPEKNYRLSEGSADIVGIVEEDTESIFNETQEAVKSIIENIKS